MFRWRPRIASASNWVSVDLVINVLAKHWFLPSIATPAAHPVSSFDHVVLSCTEDVPSDDILAMILKLLKPLARLIVLNPTNVDLFKTRLLFAGFVKIIQDEANRKIFNNHILNETLITHSNNKFSARNPTTKSVRRPNCRLAKALLLHPSRRAPGKSTTTTRTSSTRTICSTRRTWSNPIRLRCACAARRASERRAKIVRAVWSTSWTPRRESKRSRPHRNRLVEA